eukprot:4264069-Amphidinium_carterae.1
MGPPSDQTASAPSVRVAKRHLGVAAVAKHSLMLLPGAPFVVRWIENLLVVVLAAAALQTCGLVSTDSPGVVMGEELLKIIAAWLMLLAGLFGGLLVQRVDPSWREISDAFSAGLLLAVAFCHMASESADDLNAWGKQIRSSAGACSATESCAPFPLGMTL